MKIIKKQKKIIAFILGLFLAGAISGCSSEDENDVAKVKFDHEHDYVTDLEKHKFEHKFADQCVARELKNSVNKEYDKERFSKTCLCIARFMLKDLTAAEAEKFLEENKSTRSLQIRFDNAAYQCLQKNTEPEEPIIFIKRQKNVFK
jgi:hypothetical protein